MRLGIGDHKRFTQSGKVVMINSPAGCSRRHGACGNQVTCYNNNSNNNNNTYKNNNNTYNSNDDDERACGL